MCSTTRETPTKTRNPIAVNNTVRVATAGASGRSFSMSIPARSDNDAIENAKAEADDRDYRDHGRDNCTASESRCDQPDDMQKNAKQNQAADQAKRYTALP